MVKYTEIQTRKVISSYGGVESIIETPKGALKIELFDKWSFFRAIKEGEINAEGFVIEDNRLLKRLQTREGFPKLKEFLRVPPNQNKSAPIDSRAVIGSSYFPRWFYCNRCESFKRISDWWKEWKGVKQKHGEQAVKSDFVPPKCVHCYDKAKNAYKKDGKRRRLYFDLEQVRFIMTAPTGDIRDIPWERWNKVLKKDSENRSEEKEQKEIVFDWDNLCCEDQNLKYYKSKKFSDLSGIRIECKSCHAKNTLSGLFGVRIRVSKSPNVFYKPVLRTGNSCYYPILVSSIYLPAKRAIGLEDQRKIEKWNEKGKSSDFIYEALEEKYELGTIQEFIQGEIAGNFESENTYRLREFSFITEQGRIVYPGEDSDNHHLVFDRISAEQLQKKHGVDNLTAVKRLKMTTVQTAFTRQEPVSNDQFLSGASLETKIRPRYTSEYGKETNYLPAIESFGEGIFISLNEHKVKPLVSRIIDK